MFPADTLISSYVEDQTAAFEAKRRAATDKTTCQTNHAMAPIAKSMSNTSTPDATRPSTPALCIQSQAMSKPVGVLGNLWQGFFKPVSTNTTFSASSSTVSTPITEKSEQDAYAERMRDIDICAMRAW